jgi:hypothetical protein
MKKYALTLLLLFSLNSVVGQSGFTFSNQKKKITIPFQFISNLIFIPITVNGQELTFLLDTGVEETILFSIDEDKEIPFYEIEKIKLKGLGEKEAIDGFRSTKNILNVKGYKDINHEIYLVFDQDFNFSSHVGIPVNGIIGYHFFKNHKVQIDYIHKKITLFNREYDAKWKKRLASFHKEPITIELNKPYCISNVVNEDSNFKAKLLIDTGNSDALWLFLNKSSKMQLPKKNIDDYLGRGFSGEVFGKRARIQQILFGDYYFSLPIATFPDSLSIKNVNFVKDRVGSIGGEILRRFTIVFDYRNKEIFTYKNDKAEDFFNYNMSGIEVQHSGIEWVKSEVNTSNIKVFTNVSDSQAEEELQVKFKLNPVFTISNVREKSPAQLAGLKKNDKILKINGILSEELTIEKINTVLKSEEGRVIKIQIEREGVLKEVKFLLKSIL